MTAPRTAAARDPRRSARRAFWLKQLHSWHWISSALCLVGLLLFAITGITLNHPTAITAEPDVETREATLPGSLLAQLGGDVADDAPLPPAIADWLRDAMNVRMGDATPEWSADEVYVSMPRPGGDAWLAIDRGSGDVLFEATDRGWIAYFNDLHKGRDAGLAWKWFIDLFAVACIVFAVTGLFLLQMHGVQRPFTWPTVALGTLIPLLLALLFIH